VLVAGAADERHRAAGGRIGNRVLERGDIDWLAANRNRADPARLVIDSPADWGDESDFVARSRPIVVFHVFMIDGEGNASAMCLQRRKFLQQTPPDLSNRDSRRKLAIELRGFGALAQGREQFYL